MKHLDILNKIHKSISDHIDQIVKLQEESNGELDQKSAYILVEYGKFFRTDKGESDNKDLSKLSLEELEIEIQKAAKQELAERKTK